MSEMTPDWVEIAWTLVAVVAALAFAGFMLWKFIDRLTEGYGFNQKNDEINRQVDEGETPAPVDKVEPME